MTLKQMSTLLEIGCLLAVFLAFALYCAWVGPKALSGRGRP